MAKVHFRIPVTLDLRCDFEDPVTLVKRWSVWPKERPPEGSDLFIRATVNGKTRTFIGWLDGDEFRDSNDRRLFWPDWATEDILDVEDVVFTVPAPERVFWISIEELLEGVEDAEEQE
jgi:hypothetical protein